MKHFKKFLLAVLVALTCGNYSYVQTETRTVVINDYVDLDEIALIGEWNVVTHSNRPSYMDELSKLTFTDQMDFFNNPSLLVTVILQFKNGKESRFSDYIVSGSLMGKFSLHLISLNGGMYAIRYVIEKFEGNEMVLKTFDGKEVITLKRTKSGGSETNGDFVDLGLPSGLLWAKFNLGATNEHESGDYYAWGETTPNKAVYNESSYTVDWNSMPWNISGTKYDPAFLSLGEGYRMPTKEDFDELIAYCTWAFSDSEHGYRVTGPNGSSILFPFVGGKEEGYNVGYYPGVYYGQGFYMSGTKSGNNYLYNWYLYMDDDPRFGMYMYNAHRGQTIRPVSTKATAVNRIAASKGTVNVYSVSGQLEKSDVKDKESLKDLPKGLHIINGTKVMIK